jgi:hypothetical protein
LWGCLWALPCLQQAQSDAVTWLAHEWPVASCLHRRGGISVSGCHRWGAVQVESNKPARLPHKPETDSTTRLSHAVCVWPHSTAESGQTAAQLSPDPEICAQPATGRGAAMMVQRVCIVTGCTQGGMGYALCEALAAQGCTGEGCHRRAVATGQGGGVTRTPAPPRVPRAAAQLASFTLCMACRCWPRRYHHHQCMPLAASWSRCRAWWRWAAGCSSWT